MGQSWIVFATNKPNAFDRGRGTGKGGHNDELTQPRIRTRPDHQRLTPLALTQPHRRHPIALERRPRRALAELEPRRACERRKRVSLVRGGDQALLTQKNGTTKNFSWRLRELQDVEREEGDGPLCPCSLSA